MTYIEISLRSDIFSYQQNVTLDGVVYILAFRYNAREERWVMDISNSSGENLLCGIALIPSYPLTSRFIGRIDGLPDGAFVLIDETGAQRTPGRDNLGQDIKLIYVAA